MSIPSRFSRLAAVGLGGAMLGSLVLVPAAPALAADCATDTVTTLVNLNAELATGGDVYLGADIGVPAPETTAVELVPGQPATINLCGRTLSVEIAGGSAAVHVPAGASLTIMDSVGGGLLHAVGGGESAGIGATGAEDAGVITIESGTIEAIGGGQGAGIGGGTEHAGVSGTAGTITINGGMVTATGPNYGAGIGTGRFGNGGDIVITGGVVTADSPGWSGAGIGSGGSGSIDSIQISGGVVLARGSAFSSGAGNLGHGASPDAPVGTAVLTGRLPSGVSLPTTANGTGSTAIGAAPLQLVAGPELIFVTADEDEFLYAEIPAITAAPSATTATVGDTITVQTFAVDVGGGQHDVSGAVTLSSSVPEDTVAGNTVTFTHGSPHTITVDYGGLTASFIIEVAAVLPATGITETQLWLLIVAGLALLVVGAALLVIRRRVKLR